MANEQNGASRFGNSPNFNVDFSDSDDFEGDGEISENDGELDDSDISSQMMTINV
jgi:hypothetical protein